MLSLNEVGSHIKIIFEDEVGFHIIDAIFRSDAI